MLHQSEGQKNIRGLSIGALLILFVGIFFIVRVFWKADDNTRDTKQLPVTNEDEVTPTLSSQIIQQKILNGDKIVFLDVRDPEVFESERIPHSILTSPSALLSYVAEKDTTIVVVLSSGDTLRKEAVGNILRQKSYPAFLLRGGIEEWKQGGNPILSSGNPDSFLDQSKVVYITPAEALQEINIAGKVLILDVQTEQNFQKKHLKGAINIPFDQLEKRLKEVSSADSIITYGETELVSFRAGVRLNDLGIFTARTLSGNDHLKPESILPLEP